MSFSLSLYLVTFSLLGPSYFTRVPVANADLQQAIKIGVIGGIKNYNLNLEKPGSEVLNKGESVLHPNVKIIALEDDNYDDTNNKLTKVNTRTPTQSEVRAAEDIDPSNLTAVRLLQKTLTGNHVIRTGVVNAQKAKRQLQNAQQSENKHDFIDMERNITPSIQPFSTDEQIVVEIVVVIDKELGDKFNHDRKRILDYITVYFWDVNLRYKTLSSINISFRITGVIIIATPNGQPFIEEARGPDGRAEFGQILSRFSSWIYAQIGSIPKFDIAVVMTNTNLEWTGGLAYMRGACWSNEVSRRHWGTAIWNDAGDWASLTIGAREIAHLLGAPNDDDPNFPDGCSAKGYIMSGGNDELKWFFSTCSNRMIAQFVRSNEAACLRQLDESNSPPISPDFSAVLAPTMHEQCKRHLSNQEAFVAEWDTCNCKSMKCQVTREGGYSTFWFPPADNTQCLAGGRCFRGRCRKMGKLLVNAASGHCAKAQNPFAFFAKVLMTPCPNPVKSATPLDTFIVEDSPISGKILKTPWSSYDAGVNEEKCIFVYNGEGAEFLTDKCSVELNKQNPWHEWELINLPENAEFMMRHKLTKRCAKQESTGIKMHSVCDLNDRNMIWRLL